VRALGAVAFVAIQSVALTAHAVAATPIVDDAQARDPAYWIGRMEQALLPQSSMRAVLELEEDVGGARVFPSRELRAELTRVQGPDRIRSVVAVRSPEKDQEVFEITSRPGGEVERVGYGRIQGASRLQRHGYDPFLGSAFTYEDLGFVELGHRAQEATVEIESLPEGRIVRVETGPYGPYGKVITRLDWKTALPRTVEFFDAEGKPSRTVEYRDVVRDGTDSFPMQMEAVDFASGRRSRLHLGPVELGATIYEYEFRAEHLQEVLDTTESETPRAEEPPVATWRHPGVHSW
jgi:hypothetical protein